MAHGIRKQGFEDAFIDVIEDEFVEVPLARFMKCFFLRFARQGFRVEK
jgi:hypothetical protein